MTKAQRSARRFRRVILVMGIVYILAAVGWLVLPHFRNPLGGDFNSAGLVGTPIAPIDDEWLHAVAVSVFLGTVLLAQWAFLRPGRVPAAALATEGRPLKSAVAAAALMAMLLSVGALTLALEIQQGIGTQVLFVRAAVHLDETFIYSQLVEPVVAN